MFEIVTGRTFIDPVLMDRASVITGIQSLIEPPPKNWMDDLDGETRERITQANLRPMDLDRYLRFAYDQDHAQLYDIEDDECEILTEDHAKPARESTDQDLGYIYHNLRGLLTYDQASRGPSETILQSQWFKGIENYDRM